LKFIRISSLVGLGLPETFTDPLIGIMKLKKKEVMPLKKVKVQKIIKKQTSK